MDKDRLIELTSKVYGQTLLFPKKEPLRYRIREKADDILSGTVELAMGASEKKEDLFFEIEKDIEIIKSYFEVVKWQNWASYFDIIKVEDEYDELKKNLRRDSEQEEPKAKTKEAPKQDKEEKLPQMDGRKAKIIKILREKESAQVGDIKKILPNVSKRTLRRDFDLLIKNGLVQRIGESNNTFYKLN